MGKRGFGSVVLGIVDIDKLEERGRTDYLINLNLSSALIPLMRDAGQGRKDGKKKKKTRNRSGLTPKVERLPSPEIMQKHPKKILH